MLTTKEPLCVTTTGKRPAPISQHHSRIPKNCSVKALQLKPPLLTSASCKRPQQLLGVKVFTFSSLSSSCKRPLKLWSAFYVLCMYHANQRIRKTNGTRQIITQKLHSINSLTKSRSRPPLGKRPPVVISREQRRRQQ